MAYCKSFGKPKVRHETKEAAYAHRDKHHTHTNLEYDVYKCPRCTFWHIGRRPMVNSIRRELGWRARRDEVLVGKLIGVLRGTYRGSDLRLDDPEATTTATNTSPKPHHHKEG